MFSRSIYGLKFVLVILMTLSCSNDDSTSGKDLIIETISTFGGSKNDSGQSVVATQDGGYAVLGFTQSNDGDITDKLDESFDYWVMKFSANDQLQWQRSFGGTADERGRSIIQTTDGGFAILGFSFSSDGDVSENAGLQDFWLIKLNAQGNIIWQKSYGFEGSDSGISLIQTNDQGYLLAGILDVTASGGQGNTTRALNRHAGGDYWVIKVDASGVLQWSKYFGGNFTDTPEAIAQTVDGYIIAGGSDSDDTDISNNKGSYDFWVIKIDSNGNLIWEKSFGGDQIDEARAIVQTNDGHFLIAGDTRSSSGDVSNNKGAADLWLIKIDSDGNLIWEKSIGGSNFDVARSVIQAQDNGFILAGSSRSSDIDVGENKGQNDAWIVTINSSGNLISEVTVGGSEIDFAYGVAQLNDASIVAVGDTTSSDGDVSENKGFTDVLIIKLK